MLPSAIDDEPAINIFRLLEYWAEEPPAHVILALRYLGQTKKAKTEEEAHSQLMEVGGLIGGAPSPLPSHLRELAEWAEATKLKHGMNAKGKMNGRKS